MLFLTLTSDQTNFSKRENEISWTLHNFDFGCHEWVGLSSLTFDFGNTGKMASNILSNIDIISNLIDKNSFNEAGIIHTIPGKNAYAKKENFVEFWKLDSRRPKNVTFTFRHFNVNKINNFKVTLIFVKTQNAPQFMVSRYF